MEEITDEQIKKLKQSAGDDAINFAYATEKEWICVCGTYNPINDSKESVSCSNCKRNRDFTLKYLSEPTQLKSESKLTNEENNQQNYSENESSKYPALRTISGIYKVLAIIIGIGAMIALMVGFSLLGQGYRSKSTGTSLIISSLISGTIGVIAFLAISEILKLFIDLESNSRKQISLLNKLLNKK